MATDTPPVSGAPDTEPDATSAPAAGQTADEVVSGSAPAGPADAPPSKDKHKRQWQLQADHKGAQINTVVYLLYTVVCLLLAIRAEPSSLWFYVFYFLTFLAVFQGVTIVLRHCLHRTPKAMVALELVGKKIVRATLRNGSVMELTRDIDYTRKKDTLVLSGKTHDNQSYSEVIRQNALAEGEMDRLVHALKRFR